MNVTEIEASMIHYGFAVGIVAFWVSHVIGWGAGLAAVAFKER